MQSTQLTTIRKKAANDSLIELKRALERVKQTYYTKHKLRSVLHEPQHQRSITALRGHLDLIRLHARALLNVAEGVALDNKLDIPIEWAKESLKEIEQSIEQARELARDIKPFEIDETTLDSGKESLFGDATYQLDLATDSFRGLDKIWEEAFELAAGICFRHEGLDDGLCLIADGLIEEINWIKGKAFAMPSRRDVGSLSNVVHLRFPEWTIWALPLTAHEVWHLRLKDFEPDRPNRKNRLLESILEHVRAECAKDPHSSALSFEDLVKSAELVWGDSNLQCQLGDVFGVYSIGPAYACACVELALDPSDTLAKQRALTIFYTLKLVMGYEKSVTDREHIVDVLEAQWKEVAGDETKLNHKPWIDAVFSFLQTKHSGFVLERWKADHSTILSAFQTRRSEDLKSVKLNLKYVLNAAWRRRIDFPDQTDETATTCKQFCDWMLDSADEQPRPVGPSF